MSKYAQGKPAGTGRTIAVGGTGIYFEEVGRGTPLVLLHGFGGCVQNWHPFVPELSKQYRLILVDLPGHGHSHHPPGKFTHRDASGKVLELLDLLEVDHFAAMGISSGGMTLLHMATTQPERIDPLVLVSATTHFPPQARAIMRRAAFSTLPEPVREMYSACAKRGEGQIRELISSFNALADNYDDMNFSAPALSAIKSRALIVHGDGDQFFPTEIAQEMARAIPQAELWVVAGGEHAPIYDPAVPFVRRALDFLGGQARS